MKKQIESLTLLVYDQLYKDLVINEQKNLYTTCIDIFKEAYKFILSKWEYFDKPELSTLKKSIEKFIEEPKISIDDMVTIQFLFLERLVKIWKVQWINLYEQTESKAHNLLLTWEALERYKYLRSFWNEDINDNVYFNSLLIAVRQNILKMFSNDVSDEEKTIIWELFSNSWVDVAFKNLEKFEWYNEEIIEMIDKQIQTENSIVDNKIIDTD